MALFTSTNFASASASGTDWRDTSKNVLELLESAITTDKKFNFGFLYITDILADDATSILNLFRSVLNIENWVGCVGIGVCGCGESHVDAPAISAMIGHFDENDFCLFPSEEQDGSEPDKSLKPWLQKNDPMLILAHGNPSVDTDPAHNIQNLREITQGFLTGGLTSSRGKHIQFAKEVSEGAFSGVAFSTNIKVATTLSQGCTPLGPMHTITQGHEHFITELDDKNALEVFEDDLRTMTIKKIDQNPDEVVLEIDATTGKEIIPEEYQHLFKGEIHIAFPVSESDQQDYLVRNISGLDSETGEINVAQYVTSGDRVLFVHRNEDTVQSDLSQKLIALRERVQKENGNFEVKAALYVSCVARAFGQNSDPAKNEMKLIQDVIGDVPLTGFYAGGEILNGRLYGYTGVLTLFL